MIVLKINQQAFCRIPCLRSGSPIAKVVDQTVVRISPTPSMRNGFQITCDSEDEAQTIAEALQSLIDGEYPYMFP